MKKNVPAESIEILLASLSQSTIKQYGSALKQWFLFCNNNKLDFHEPTRNALLRFLTESYEKGASYATLNTYRSAIALLSVEQLGDDAMIKKFFKGVFRLRPALPKYSFTWDVSIVLKYLKRLEPLSSLNLQSLTEKTVTLLALCTAHRAQTLAAIKVSNIMYNAERVEIKVPDRIKTSGPGRLQPLLLLPNFKDDNRICVATVLKEYIKATKSIRKNEDNLFISTKKPFKSVSSQTISRWIKSVLYKSGIDVSIFNAHSTRHASTSAAMAKGIDLGVIRRTAGWTNNSEVFARFYNRPVKTNDLEFATAILQS